MFGGVRSVFFLKVAEQDRKTGKSGGLVFEVLGGVWVCNGFAPSSLVSVGVKCVFS